MKLPFACLLLVALFTGCGSSGSGSSAPGVAAPSQLSYGTAHASMLVQVEFQPLTPTAEGQINSWGITPSLPSGLAFDTSTGTISGTPDTEFDPKAFKVTAYGPGGQGHAWIEIEVQHPARFAFVAGEDHTVGIYTVDAQDGALRFHGLHHHLPIDGGVEQAEPDPSGRFLYVSNRGQIQQDSTVTAYKLDTARGKLDTVGTYTIGEGPHRLLIDPQGEFLYAASYADHRIWVYSIDQDTGALTWVETTLTNTGPERMAMDPEGRWLYVTHRPSADVAIFTVHPDGRLTDDLGGFNYYAFIPVDVAIDHESEYAYFVFEVTNNLVTYRINPNTGYLTELFTADVTGTPRTVRIHPKRRFAYVACPNTGTIDVFKLSANNGQAIKQFTYPAGATPTDLAFDPSGRQLYVLDEVNNQVRRFAVSPGTGELSPLSNVRTRATATHLSILRGDQPAYPSEEYVYVVNKESDDVSGFTIDLASGTLSSTGANVLVDDAPDSVVVRPWGDFAFVASSTEQSLATLAIDSGTGALTQPTLPYSLNGVPGGMAIDRSGNFVYVSLRDRDELVSLQVLVDGSVVEVDRTATSPGPMAVSTDPTGQFVYVSNQGSANHTISTFRVARGIFGATFTDASAPGHPERLTFHSSGELAYVPLRSSKLVVPYKINSVNGDLEVVANGTQQVSTLPSAITLTPDGRYAYAAVDGDQSEVGFVACFDVDPQSGALEPTGEFTSGLSPRDLIVGPTGSFLYVINEQGDDLSLHSIADDGSLEVMATLPAGLSPAALILATKVE